MTRGVEWSRVEQSGARNTVIELSSYKSSGDLFHRRNQRSFVESKRHYGIYPQSGTRRGGSFCQVPI